MNMSHNISRISDIEFLENIQLNLKLIIISFWHQMVSEISWIFVKQNQTYLNAFSEVSYVKAGKETIKNHAL